MRAAQLLALLFVLSGTGSPAALAEELSASRRAEDLLRTGDLAGATGLLKFHLQQNPTDIAAREVLHDILLSTGRGDEALRAAQALAKQEPDSADAWYLLGRSHPEVTTALAAYEQALQRDSEHARSWMGIAAVRRVQGQLDESISAYERALDLDPQLLEAWNGLIGVYGDKGAYGQARGVAERALAIVPHEPKIWLSLAVLDAEQSHEVLSKGVIRHPDDLGLRYAYARAEFDRGRYASARTQYEEAARIAPNMPELWVEHGLAGELMTGALERDGAVRLLRLRDVARLDPAKALNELDEVVAANPHSGWALLVRGNVRHAMATYPAAESDLRAAFDRMPTSPEAQAALGVLLLGLKRPAEARPLLQAAVQRRPRDVSLVVASAMSAGESGDVETAERELLDAWKAFPGNPGPPLGLGRLQLALGQPELAYGVLARALEQAPHAELVLALSAAAIESGRPLQAAELLESLASVTGDDTFAKAGAALREEAQKAEEVEGSATP